jgi:hypothetical protein
MSESAGEIPRVVGGRPHPEDLAPAEGEIASARQEWGDRSRLLRIGSLTVELTGLDERLEGLLVRNYEGFLAGGGDEPTANLRSRPAGLRILRTDRERFLYLPRAEGKSEEARLDARFGDRGIELWSYFFAASFDRDANFGSLLLCDGEELDLIQALENCLRFFVSTLALRQGGFLLHSSGVIKDGRAVLFFGPSGAGKSTTAANAPGCQRLGDDLVLVEPWRDASFRACGVPFRGSFAGDDRNSSECAPLALVCRLVQARENRLESTSKPVQTAELVSQLPFLLDDADLRQRAMRMVGRVVDAVPVRRLHLTNDESYWSVLEPELR